MRTLIVSQDVFIDMISGIIESGVTFEAKLTADNEIKIVFTGGY